MSENKHASGDARYRGGFTISNGEIFPILDTATTTPETGDKSRPKLEACNIGMVKNAGFTPICVAN